VRLFRNGLLRKVIHQHSEDGQRKGQVESAHVFAQSFLFVVRRDDTIRKRSRHCEVSRANFKMAIIGIVAVDRNLAIGKGGTLPWHYSADLKFFKQTTVGNAVVMGNRTWQSLKRPLPDRLNVVLTRQSEMEAVDSVVRLPSVESILTLAQS